MSVEKLENQSLGAAILSVVVSLTIEPVRYWIGPAGCITLVPAIVFITYFWLGVAVITFIPNGDGQPIVKGAVKRISKGTGYMIKSAKLYRLSPQKQQRKAA